MKYSFEVTDAIRDKRETNNFSGEFTGFNSFNGGTNKTIENNTFRFDISESDIPSFKNGEKFVELKAAEDILVRSIWKGFIGLANNGINNLANSINKLFNGGYKDQTQLDTNEPFMPTLIHTGVKCTMPKNEIMHINIFQDNGLLIAGGTRIYTGGSEIVIPLYNIYPTDISVNKGQTVAVATFHPIGLEDANNYKVNLTKAEGDNNE